MSEPNGKVRRPELLVPVGDVDRLFAAIKYGADAVYLGGTMFGMRSAAAKFDEKALKSAVEVCHKNGVKLYLTANVLPRNDEIKKLPAFLENAQNVGVDALIISDLGVFNMAKKYAPDVDIHVSTQAGIVNFLSANAFFEMGAKRIVTARELSLDEICEIRKNVPPELEIECFVHGAMCMSFSGRCLISNYLTGRDSNRGDCAQPCRWKYHLKEDTRPDETYSISEFDEGTYLFNSKDMCMIEHIPELLNAGIDSFKIEGRAKSEYYVACVTNAYRTAIDLYLENPSDYVLPQFVLDELFKVSYRDYCTGFFFKKPNEDANISYKGGYNRHYNVVGVVDKCENGRVFLTQRNRFFEGDILDAMQKGAPSVLFKVTDLRDEKGEKIDQANHAMQKCSFSSDQVLSTGTYLRLKI